MKAYLKKLLCVCFAVLCSFSAVSALDYSSLVPQAYATGETYSYYFVLHRIHMDASYDGQDGGGVARVYGKSGGGTKRTVFSGNIGTEWAEINPKDTSFCYVTDSPLLPTEVYVGVNIGNNNLLFYRPQSIKTIIYIYLKNNTTGVYERKEFGTFTLTSSTTSGGAGSTFKSATVTCRSSLVSETADNSDHFPSGYNFNNDSYGFTNYSDYIDIAYFRTMFGNSKAFSLWKKYGNAAAGGVCAGMAVSTAALWNGLPHVDRIRSLINAGDSSFSLSSTININGRWISIRDYIKYCFIYQISVEGNPVSIRVSASELYDIIRGQTNADHIGITLRLLKTDSGHRVLPVGYRNNTILIDDPNRTSLQQLVINDDGSWTYSGPGNYNPSNTHLEILFEYGGPYRVLSTGSNLLVGTSYNGDTCYCITDMDIVDKDKLLLSVDAKDYSLPSEGVYKIESDGSEGDENEEIDCFWIDNDTIKISDVTGDNSTIEVADNDCILSVVSGDSSDIEFSMTQPQKTLSIASDYEKEYSVSVMSFDSDGTEDFGENNKTIVNISGNAASDYITAVNTEEGIIATGFNDFGITYSNNDEVLDVETVSSCAGNDILISVDEETKDITATPVEHTIHVWGNEETITPATCSESGSQKFHCVVCGEEKTVQTSATGHAYGNWTKVDETNHKRVCANDTDHVEIAEHSWNEPRLILEPTCTTDGIQEITCAYCDASYEEPIDKTGHDFGEWITFDEMNHQRICANDESHVEIQAHTWNSGIITKPPTCTADGVRTFTCTVCNAEKTESIDKLNHSFGAWAKLNDAQHQRVCANDPGHVETANHTWDSGRVTIPASCVAEGAKAYTCTVCGASKTEKLGKTNHRDGNNDGWCDDCSAELYAHSQPTQPEDPGQNSGDTCKYCGQTHSGFMGKIVQFFHNILYFFKNLFR